jgi:hypothetical protein
MKMGAEIFEPCRQRADVDCTGAYFDAVGERHVCACTCHRQTELFGAPASRQRELNFSPESRSGDLEV